MSLTSGDYATPHRRPGAGLALLGPGQMPATAGELCVPVRLLGSGYSLLTVNLAETETAQCFPVRLDEAYSLAIYGRRRSSLCECCWADALPVSWTVILTGFAGGDAWLNGSWNIPKGNWQAGYIRCHTQGMTTFCTWFDVFTGGTQSPWPCNIATIVLGLGCSTPEGGACCDCLSVAVIRPNGVGTSAYVRFHITGIDACTYSGNVPFYDCVVGVTGPCEEFFCGTFTCSLTPNV